MFSVLFLFPHTLDHFPQNNFFSAFARTYIWCRKHFLSEVFSRSFPNQCNCSRCFYLLVGWFYFLVRWHPSPFHLDIVNDKVLDEIMKVKRGWTSDMAGIFQIFHSTPFLQPHKRVLKSFFELSKYIAPGTVYFRVLLMWFDLANTRQPILHQTIIGLFCFSGP